MFGLLRPRKDQLCPHDWADYASAYCNLCACLSARYGLPARLLVVHDVAAADWLLAGAGPVRRTFPTNNCLKGGTRSVPAPVRPSERERFLAAVSAYTIGVKVQDDLADQPSWKTRVAHYAYRDTFAKAGHDLAALGFDLTGFEAVLTEQRELERRGERDLSAAAAPSGAAFALVARHLAERCAANVAAADAFALGERIGRSVFLVDAYRDLADDQASGAYNPLGCEERRPELVGAVEALLDEAAGVCERLAGRVAARWRGAEATLASGISPDKPKVPPVAGELGKLEGPGEEDEEGEKKGKRKRNKDGPAPCCSGCSWFEGWACCEVTCCCCEVGACL